MVRAVKMNMFNTYLQAAWNVLKESMTTGSFIKHVFLPPLSLTMPDGERMDDFIKKRTSTYSMTIVRLINFLEEIRLSTRARCRISSRFLQKISLK